MTDAFVHGFVLAFGLILPLGVQNLFVFNQGATQKTFIRALPVIITASLCDTFLILLAVLGVSLLVLNLAWFKTVLSVLGFLFISCIGWITWRSTSFNWNEDKQKDLSYKKQILFAASVSLLNPHAILDTVGVIGTSSVYYGGNEKWLFTLAAILVSWAWFFGLAAAGKALGNIDRSGRWTQNLNRVSAVIMWGAALYLGLSIWN
ncbi:MAG: LysE/ArgO family amino acid transporter [Bacillota bacterium]